ncbi:uncharacterized protein DS421_16g550110 [Arachis hypogaea]|nr:uncharacterized protein DS421_16g550110 [Arachis hypogaea]
MQVTLGQRESKSQVAFGSLQPCMHDTWIQWEAIKNLLPRKLDPPDTFNEVAAAVLALTGFEHVSPVGKMRGHSTLLIECLGGTLEAGDSHISSFGR